MKKVITLCDSCGKEIGEGEKIFHLSPIVEDGTEEELKGLEAIIHRDYCRECLEKVAGNQEENAEIKENDHEEYTEEPVKKEVKDHHKKLGRRKTRYEDAEEILCDSCIYNAESRTLTKKDTDGRWGPCFNCDECYHFGHDISNGIKKRVECEWYRIDNNHAEKMRKRLKIIEGAGNADITN